MWIEKEAAADPKPVVLLRVKAALWIVKVQQDEIIVIYSQGSGVTTKLLLSGQSLWVGW